MKNVIEIVEKPMIIVFLLGLIIIEIIEGRLPNTDATIQKKSNVCLEK